MNLLNVVLKIKLNSALFTTMFIQMMQIVLISRKVPECLPRINADALLMARLMKDTAPLY